MKQKRKYGRISMLFLINIILIVSSIGSQEDANITESTLSAEAKSLLISSGELSINGTVFQDINTNAARDDGEIGLIGWTIKLFSNGSEIRNTRTDGFGHYAINNLEPGRYIVTEMLQSGWNQTCPGNGTYRIILTDTNANDIDFGNTLRKEYISNTTTGMNLTIEEFQREKEIQEILPSAFIHPIIKANLLNQTQGQYFSLYNNLHNIMKERNQGNCGCCAVYGSHGVMDIDKNLRYGTTEEENLSIQYFSSNYGNGNGCSFDCCGVWPSYVANFYTNVLKKAIPASNNNAKPFADGERCCVETCPNGNDECDALHGTTAVAASSIADNPNYPINSITTYTIPTTSAASVTKEEAIRNIKNVLLQHKAIAFTMWQPTQAWIYSDFHNHWNSKSQGDIWTPDVSSWTTTSVWGHTILCVGFDDRDSANPYWIMVNSWGITPNRPNGIVYISMNNMDYSYQIAGHNAFQFDTFDISWKDDFGYTLIDNIASSGGSVYDWIEISEDGTEILPNSDDQFVSNIPLGFFFNYYGTDYSQLAISNNGLLFSGEGSTRYTNQPIKKSDAVHGFISPFWDDLVTWNAAGSVYYKTIGAEPNRKFVVEWKDNQHFHDSTEGTTFEAILYEGSNNIQFQYQDTTFGTVTDSTVGDSPPYDLGGSATIGIESPDGNDGLAYSFNTQLIVPNLAILFKFPQFANTNLYLSKQAPASKDHGSTMIYSINYHNFGHVTAQNVVLTDTLPAEVEYVSSSDGGSYDPSTRNVTWNIGSVLGSGHGYRTVTVRIPESVAVGTIIQNEASISTETLEDKITDNKAHAQTEVTASNLPPNVGVEPNLGGTTPSVYWTTPITFSYYHPTATGVDIRIHLDDSGQDITGSMINGPPGWTYTTTFYPRTGHATVTYTVQGEGPINFNIYIDPAGYIYDINTNERIEGASVWLQRPDGAGEWENVPTGQTPAIMQPDQNPLVTGADGQYQWDVLEGSYRVHVEASGYYPTDSIVVSIPPPVTDLHVGLTPINAPPNKPSMPLGPTSGVTETSYGYSTSANDPNENQLKYTFDWDDDTTTTTELVDSGTTLSESHAWENPGTYQIKAMATDNLGASSEWSDPRIVSIADAAINWHTGRTTPGATNWKAEGSSAIYVDVDTSAAEFPSTPLYFTSLWGTGNHWNAQGINAVYRARSAGFRIYLKSNTGVALTPAYANRQGWCVQWLGVIPETNTCSGFTPKGATNWKAEGSKAIYVDVDTSAAEFPSTPIYFTSLGGSGNHWNAQGINAVYRARPTGFRIYLKSVTGATLTPTYANSQGWNVQWLGVVPETNSNSGSTPKGTTNWKTEGSKAIYVDVDTSAAEFPSTPFYFTSLWGTGNHWNAQGINAVYRARSTGFRIYLKSNTGTALTPAYANRQGWCVQWLGV